MPYNNNRYQQAQQLARNVHGRERELQTKLIGVGRMLPSGNHGGVGVGGFTLGCGRSYLSRAFGLACDFVVAARVATADDLAGYGFPVESDDEEEEEEA